MSIFDKHYKFAKICVIYTLAANNFYERFKKVSVNLANKKKRILIKHKTAIININ